MADDFFHFQFDVIAPPAFVPRLRVGKLWRGHQGATPAELIERAQAALADSKFLEFRLIRWPNPLPRC